MVMHVELQATCSTLGYQEGEKYIKEPDCLETVKDLIKFLKREDETCDIRQQLGHAQILQNDLIPLVKHYKKDRTLIEAVIRLMVNLSQPSILCFGNKLPEDKTIRNHYMETEAILQSYKEACVDEELFAVLTEKMGDMLKLDWEHRHEEDRMFIERLLILVRNILHVPPNPQEEKRTDDDASIHDQVLWALHVSGMEDLLLYIASSDEERQYCLHVLEIISLMFREQTPDLLAHAGIQRSLTEKDKDQRELELARQKEKSQKMANVLKFSSRHSRFGGTYVMKNVTSISDKEMIYHRSLSDANNISFDNNKKAKKMPKNRQTIKDVELIRRSTLSIRLALKDFCTQFLDNCYNPLMKAVKDTLSREKSQEHDETYYMWAMRFFMEFCRGLSAKVELVSETMSVQSFHYIYTNLLNYYEMIMTEKKEGKIWSRRVHLALKAYQELLMTLNSMDKCPDEQIRESAKVIKSNIFYVMEFRDIFLTLLRKFDQSKQSRSYLKDLIETTHLFLKLLEAYCKGSSHLVVQRKKNAKPKPRKRKDKNSAEANNQELEDLWDEVSGELSTIFQGRADIPDDVSPFDAASEIDVDQQRADAMFRIQDSLRGQRAGEAVSLFRAAREVWPDRGEFGTTDISPEDEFMALREIFFTDIPRSSSQAKTQEYPPGFEEEEEEDHEVEEEEISAVVHAEQEFQFKEYAGRYAKPQIVKPYVILMSEFEKNSDYTNHCVVKMMHRIGIDMGMMGMLFQASLFRVFQKLLFSSAAKSAHYQEMVKFSLHVVKHFVAATDKNDKIFMELLFWKTTQDAVEIVEGYGTASSSKVKQLWTEDQEQELQRLFEEYQEVNDDRDIVDHIMDDLTDREKSRGQVIRQLKRQSLIESAKDLKKKSTGARPGVWTEGHEMELRDLLETYRNSDDPVGNIVANMETKRSKLKVMEKLLELQLVLDRKELYKKRRGGKKGRAGSSDREGDSDDNMEEGEFMEEPEFMVEPELDSAPSSDEEQAPGGDSSDSPNKQLEDIIGKVVTSGFRDQIQWIQRGLRRTADDRANSENAQPMPIVPLTEENEDAMEEKTFQSFLQKIGISPPADEQETFWRIPASLTVEDLRSIADGLELDDENKPTSVDKIASVLANKPKAASQKVKKQKNKKLDQLRAKVTKKLQVKDRKRTKKSQEKEIPKRNRKEKEEQLDNFIASDSENESGSDSQGGSDNRSGSDSNNGLGRESDDHSSSRKKSKPSKKLSKKKSKQGLRSEHAGEVVSSQKSAKKSAKKRRLKRPLQSDSDDSDDGGKLVLNLSEDETLIDSQRNKRPRINKLEDSDDDDNDGKSSSQSQRPKSTRKAIVDSDDDLSRDDDKSLRNAVLDDVEDPASRDSHVSTLSSLSNASQQSSASSKSNASQKSSVSTKSGASQKSSASSKSSASEKSSASNKSKISEASKSSKPKVSKRGKSKQSNQLTDIDASLKQSQSKKRQRKKAVKDSYSHSDEDLPLKRQRVSPAVDDESTRDSRVSQPNDANKLIEYGSQEIESSKRSSKFVEDESSDEDTPLVLLSQPPDEDSQTNTCTDQQLPAPIDSFPATLFTQPVNSDDSDHDHIPLKRVVKGRRIDCGSEED